MLSRIEVEHLLLEDVADELLGGRVARHVGDLADAIVEIAVDLHLDGLSSKHPTLSFFGGSGRAVYWIGLPTMPGDGSSP